MVDPTWVGGISETRRLAELAQAYNIPATMHDCTGPLTVFAGLHVATAVPNVTFQETVRAHIRTFYSQLIGNTVQIRHGWAIPPEGPGLGTRLNADLFAAGRDSHRISSWSR